MPNGWLKTLLIIDVRVYREKWTLQPRQQFRWNLYRVWQIRKIGLPEFVRPMRRMLKRLLGRQHDKGWTRHQVIRPEDALAARG